ncbi:hypothetical protein [Bradyrhizobium japonicum]|nr:hypothetical protein [Bradyrhizobium japonicum]
MRLRPVNLSKRNQDSEHQAAVERAVERRDEEIAAAKGVFRRLIKMAEIDAPDAPRRDVGSEQHVLVLKCITLASTIHPDDRADLSEAELSEVIGDSSEDTALSPDFHRHVDRIPDGIHRAMLGFQRESQEKAMADHEAKLAKKAAKARRRAERAGHKVEADVVKVDRKKARAEAEKFAGQRREQAMESYDRYKHGFYYPGGGRKIAGDIYDAFHEFHGEDILRSHLSPSLARFAQIVPKRGRIRAGYTKEALFSTATKLIALDAPYVELDQTRFCCVVVEFDTAWASAAAFRLALLQYLPAKMLPNLIVGRMTRSGLFSRPHAIWFLNPNVVLPDGTTRNACVWNEPYREWTDQDTGEVKRIGDKRCRKGPIDKYHAVQRGLVAHLLPLGADPGCWNIWKPKNPCSPFWSTLIANEDFWPELDDFIAIKDFAMNVDEAELARRGAVMRAEAAGEIKTPSNLAWSTVGHVIEPLVRLQLQIRDPGFLEAGRKGIETLARWLDDRVRPQVEDELPASPALDRVIDGRCRWGAAYCLGRMFKPRRRSVNRGRDRDLVFSMPDVAERHKERSVRSGAIRHAVAIWRMGQELSVTGLSVDDLHARKTEIIKGLGLVSPSFAYDNWDEAVALLSGDSADMHKDKKLNPSPAQTIDPTCLNQTLRGHGDAVDPATPAQTIDLPWFDDGDGPPEVGLRELQRQHHAFGPVDARVDATNDAPAAVPA